VNVFQNTEVSVRFSEPLDPTSVGPATFQVINVSNGTSPDGRYLIDPLDPRRAIFRPAIVFQGGGVTFSFLANTTYEILIPGAAQGDNGPYITSTVGRPNESRMQCTVLTSEGVTDPVPGNPIVEIDVVRVTSYAAGLVPATFETVTLDNQAPPVTDVFRNSPIVFRFNELMNIATVATNASGSTPSFSPFIAVEFDLDSNLITSGPGDRFTWDGDYHVEIDNENLLTTLTYMPFNEYPSSGGALMRLLVIRVPQQVTDLTNKPVLTSTGGGTLAVITESLPSESIFVPSMAGETFDIPGGQAGSLEDVSHNGANWGTLVGSEQFFSAGRSGGSGRLGELVIRAGEVVTLNTDSQVFPIERGPLAFDQVDVIGNQTGMPLEYPFSITVTTGVFEFSSLIVAPTGRLVLTGSNPARVLVRGPLEIGAGAVIDVSGASAPQHDSLTAKVIGVATPIPGGTGGGDGGLGADRADFTGTTMIQAGGLANPGAIRDGQPGQGVGGGAVGGGGGGPRYPNLYPTARNIPPMTGANGQVTQNIANLPPTSLTTCMSLDMGGPGGGGSYSRTATAGSTTPSSQEPLAEFVPVGTGATNALRGPVGTPGDIAGLGLEPSNPSNAGYNVRLLRWENGHLRGGAGGGGGGNHPYLSITNGDTSPANCFVFFTNIAPDWQAFRDHSAASGGGAGGAVDLLSGKRIDLDGVIEARGGSGGSSLSGAMSTNFGQYATPGGGASGGAVRISAPVIDVLPGGTRIDVGGGLGGAAFWATVTMMDPATTLGGNGSPGLVRIEDGNASASQVTFSALAPLVAPFDSLMPNASLDFLSVAPNFITGTPTRRPDSVSAGSSCWIQPMGNFISLGFRADQGNTVEEQGWTMNVVVDQGSGPVKRPFRGTSTQFPTSWESQFGNLLGYNLGVGQVASPIVVRFQGARARQTVSSPCNVDPNDFSGPIEPGTLTRWVAHPSELNGILSQAGNVLTPNIVRFVVIFDRTDEPLSGDTPGQIFVSQGVLGVDDLRIVADPQ